MWVTRWTGRLEATAASCGRPLRSSAGGSAICLHKSALFPSLPVCGSDLFPALCFPMMFVLNFFLEHPQFQAVPEIPLSWFWTVVLSLGQFLLREMCLIVSCGLGGGNESLRARGWRPGCCWAPHGVQASLRHPSLAQNSLAPDFRSMEGGWLAAAQTSCF